MITIPTLTDRIYASLALAGIGDALGAPTEQWTIDEIYRSFGGVVQQFVAPPADTFAGANGGLRAEVTDDASQMYYLARALIAHDGWIDDVSWRACLLDWADHCDKAGFMGPSTAAIVAAWREGRDPATVGVIGQSTRKMSSIGNTNGAAMRVAPIGLLHPNDIEGSCAQALVTCLPAHDTDVAISAACVIAAACSVAVGGASLERVIEAAIEGAERGEQLGRRYARRVAGPRLSRRLERALIIATGGLAERPFLEALEEEIGNSVLAAESVPSALAIVLYARADPMRSVALCATAGNDTDSMATMAGAIAGAMAGSSELPPHLLSQFEQANRVHYDLSAMADAMGRLAYGRQI